jgi:hypothetical protein
VGRAIDPEPGDGRLDHSICPGVPCPETVLVARMTGGSYLLMAYPHREPACAARILGYVLDLRFFGRPGEVMLRVGTRW